MGKYINAYERALLQVENKLNQMGAIVIEHLELALKAFFERDIKIAGTVIARDNEIDTFDEKIEMESLEIISLQQPLDYDLRFLNAVMRIGRELERISDYCCDIAESVSYLNQEKPFFDHLEEVCKMAELVQGMLKRSLRAHFERDLDTAWRMDSDDTEVDNIFISHIQVLINYLKEEPDFVDQASILILIVRYLERIGDHVVNISEMTVFVEIGIRHPYKKDKTD